MKLPIRITPNPIYEAAVEIRFESQLPSDAVFGVAFSVLKDQYPNFEKQPILQVPEVLRNSDPNLAIQAHYKLRKENFIVQIGPRVLGLSITPTYTNWEEYRSEIIEVFDRLKSVGIVARVSRFGLRYIDRFDCEILDKLNVNLQVMNRRLTADEVYLRTMFKSGDFNVLLQIVNASDVLKSAGPSDAERQSVVDTDISLEAENLPFFDKMEAILDDAHNTQKEIFFSLLKPDFLESLNPEYSE